MRSPKEKEAGLVLETSESEAGFPLMSTAETKPFGLVMKMPALAVVLNSLAAAAQVFGAMSAKKVRLAFENCGANQRRYMFLAKGRVMLV